VAIWGELRRAGVLGINRRNAQYTLRWNPRRLYPRVDNKLVTKQLCQQAGIPVPRLIAVAQAHYQIRGMVRSLATESSFVLKPARGAMDNGILMILARDGDRLLRPGGRWTSDRELSYHAASIISGLYALGGQRDEALVEERLEVHPELREIATEGVPDLRVIVFRGVPVMAMMRLPTRRSGGRANLHQGAIGVGVDLVTGTTTHAILRNRSVTIHPDSGERVVGRVVPSFDHALEIAVRTADATELGYVGADVVVDAARGPMILECNARPGLAVQAANRAGLLPRLEGVARSWKPGLSLAERIELGRGLARDSVAQSAA
jgi:alpha-L-glutamate ligase-like protein